MLRVAHFEVTADDPERATQFYSSVFGWDISKWDGPQEYWLVKTGERDKPGGINGGIMRRDGYRGHINTVEVPSVDEFVNKVVAHGGAVEVPKMAIPGVGYIAYCKDTEGNVFGIMQADSSAA
jgi:hypothetical protein